MKPKKKRKYLASEWLRTCKSGGHQAAAHNSADAWLHGQALYCGYGEGYPGATERAESAEFSERAIGLKPLKFYGDES